MTTDTLLSHLLQRIEAAEVLREPFFHLDLKEIFPKNFYHSLLSHFPNQDHFKELRHPHAILEDGTSSRLEIVFSKNSLAKLPDDQKRIWEIIYDALASKQFEQALLKIHHPALLSRFGSELSTLKLSPRIALMQDLDGYRIGIHRDIRSKAITTQFYLPENDKHEHIGTSFYSKSKAGDYVLVKKRPFKPNIGYSFTVTDDSFHGVVEPLSKEDSPRKSLMIIYYINK